jgi:hypothetical protein
MSLIVNLTAILITTGTAGPTAKLQIEGTADPTINLQTEDTADPTADKITALIVWTNILKSMKR